MKHTTAYYLILGFMSIAIIAMNFQDVLPEYTKWFVDTAGAATALAGLFVHPPDVK